jgi:hypothetical protein
MRPQISGLDGLHHARPEHLQLEVGVLQLERNAGQSTRQEYRDG